MIKYFLIFTFILSLHSCTSPNLGTNDGSDNSSDVCQSGQSRQGYLNEVSVGSVPCIHAVQTCISGKWVGPKISPTCSSLIKDCDGHPHGTIQNGFLQPTASGGMPCTPALRTCVNGNWMGPEVYSSCTQVP